MPKMKTHSGAKKRFKKTAKRKRHLGKETEITGQDAANAKRMLQGQGR